MTYQTKQPALAGTSAGGQIIVPDEKLLVAKTRKIVRAATTIFTDWHVFSGNGIFNVKYENPEMGVDSNVMVSISEMTTNDSPFIGNAAMSIANVAPFNHGAWVKVNIAWDRPLRFQLMFLWSNG
jgi:hypothetical protein